MSREPRAASRATKGRGAKVQGSPPEADLVLLRRTRHGKKGSGDELGAGGVNNAVQPQALRSVQRLQVEDLPIGVKIEGHPFLNIATACNGHIAEMDHGNQFRTGRIPGSPRAIRCGVLCPSVQGPIPRSAAQWSTAEAV